MNICHVFNMAGNGWQVCKALRQYTNLKPDLIVNSRDFGMSQPMWEEEAGLKEDPYKRHWSRNEYSKVPDWVKVWHVEDGMTNHANIILLHRLVKDYDILHLHPPSGIYLQFTRQKTVVYESGWIRTLSERNTVVEKMGRRSYKVADAITFTNPDTWPLLNPYSKHTPVHFLPFIIDPEKYKPEGVNHSSTEKDMITFFNPSRINFAVKGTDRLIRAYARFVRSHPTIKSKLIFADWGWKEDVESLRSFIADNDLQDRTALIPPLSKPDLVRMYNSSDLIFDQFVLGSYGSAAPEAMSCGKPVVMYLNRYWNERFLGEYAPILQASSEDDIFRVMELFLVGPDYCIEIGKLARDYTLRHHHPKLVADRVRDIYEEVEAA